MVAHVLVLHLNLVEVLQQYQVQATRSLPHPSLHLSLLPDELILWLPISINLLNPTLKILVEAIQHLILDKTVPATIMVPQSHQSQEVGH